MKKSTHLIYLTMILFLAPLIDCIGQYVNCKYTKDGVEQSYPVLKKSGGTWYWNSREAKNPRWESETYPFYINAEGELFDVNQVKIGWYINDDFYLMDGWVVLNNKKTYYKHKEMIFKLNEITGRTCSDSKFWFVSKGDTKHYLFQTADKINGGRKTVLSLELVNLEMDKVTAVALFEFIKMGLKDTDPCGFGSDDVRPEFTTVTPLSEKEIQRQDDLKLLAEIDNKLANIFTDRVEKSLKTVSFKNNSKVDIFIAIAWRENDDWIVKGLFNVKSDSTMVLFQKEYGFSSIYWYAEDDKGGAGRKWEGSGPKFCIDRTQAFELSNLGCPTKAKFNQLQLVDENTEQIVAD